MRLDQFLVENLNSSSKTAAQALIKEGYVFILKNDIKSILTKPSFEVTDFNKKFIGVAENELNKFVSRAGLKLEAAMQQLSISFKNKKVLDVGQSTGGFTDCLLKYGAESVVGVDVGHGQLHSSLYNNIKIKSLENLNIKDIQQSNDFINSVPSTGFDFIVMDVSFISLIKVTSFLFPYLKYEGEYLFLVKPQFECGVKNLDKNGIVKNKKVYNVIENSIKENCLSVYGQVENYIESKITGKDGNQEFFIYGKKII